MSEKNNKRNSARQNENITNTLKILKKVWMVFFTSAKIAIGAVSTVLLIGIVCGFVFVGILGDYLEEDILPNASVILDDYDLDAPSTVYHVDENGKIAVLQELYASTDWKKATYEEIPKALIHAAVAIEDKRFYEHQGVDWITTIKAFANMFFGSDTVGGSSITQQLIKNKTQKDSVTVQRKVQEFFSATLVEKNNDKKVIIEEYLNSIYMGQGCRGVKSAAESYFGKELQMLTIAECASLISITNNPSLFDPYGTEEFMYKGELMNGRERNRNRQLLVLGEMLSQGYITKEEHDEAVAQELVLKNHIDEQDEWVICENAECGYQGIRSTFTADDVLKCPKCGTQPEIIVDASQEVYSYFVDALVTEVAKAMAEKDGITEWNKSIRDDYMDRISRGGYSIYATIDTKVQEKVDMIYKDLEKVPDTYSAQQLQSAIVIIDNRTGDIVALSGGVGNDKVHFGFNRATQAELQTGSTIKPLTIYAPGFEQGTISPATVIKDLPMNYSSGAWPRNDNREYSYTRTVFGGIVASVNAVAANTLQKIGANYGYDFAKESFGLSLVEQDLQFSSLALGAQERGISVREMTCAFATFANGGVYRTGRLYTKVYDRKGNLVLDNPQEEREILSEKSINYINYCLQKAVESGTGSGADFYDVDIAGKTGSTSSFRDRWFCGFTGHYTASVWCGYDTPETIHSVSGGNVAARMWKYVMEPVHEGLENIKLYDSREMVSVSVCLDTGKLATNACEQDIRGGRTQSVLVYPEDVPTGSCDKHCVLEYCSGGGVATEYCKQFAAVDTTVKLEKKGLLKLTKEQIDEILAAEEFGLKEEYLKNEYVYYIDADGKDQAFKGFHNDINKTVEAPYMVCPVHTKEAWEAHQSQNPTTPDGSTPGTDVLPPHLRPVEPPETPTEPVKPTEPQPTEPEEPKAPDWYDNWWD